MRQRAGLLATAFVLVACAGQQDAPASSLASSTSESPATSGTGQPAPPTSAAATPAKTLMPHPSSSLRNEASHDLAMFESTVNGLQLRAGPSLASPGFVFPCNPVGGCTEHVVIDAGWTMVAFAGPVAADGYDWYLVQLTPEHPGSAHLGWVATPQTGDDWLVASEYECPATPPDLTEAIGTGAVPLLYCHGGEELSFNGYVVTGFGCNVMGTFEPAWLAHPCANMSYISPVEGSNDETFLHFPAPGVVNPTLEFDDGQSVQIQGHFDDPAAGSCVMEDTMETEMDPASTLSARDAAADVARCRTRFVVTDVTVMP